MDTGYSDITVGNGRISAGALAVLIFLTSGVPASAQTSPGTSPTRTIIPVLLNGGNGDITVGSTTYKGANPGFHVLALRRQPSNRTPGAPDLAWDKTYTTAPDTFNALVSIRTAYPDALLMVNAVGNYGFALADSVGMIGPVISSVGLYLGLFGGDSDLTKIAVTTPFIFVGIGGANAQTALQRGSSTRDLQGYLAPDSSGNYAFIQTDFVRYDITTDGTIRIGSKTYKVANAPYKPGCDAVGSNSFHLVVVDREAPEGPPIADNAYCGNYDSMAVDLGGVVNEGALVFIASNGRPIPSNWNFGTDGDARVYRLAQQIGRLGGYWETMVYLSPTDTYSLVGAPPPPDGIKGAGKRARESSSVYPEVSAGVRPTGELHGVLARGRGNWYSPLNADPSGYANLGLYEVLATPYQPFPGPFGTAEVSAFQYITGKLCNGCNIRDLYDDLNVSFETYQTTLTALGDAAGKSCDTTGSGADASFCKIRGQLLTEFTYVVDIRKLYTNVQSLWLGSGTVTILSQLNAYNEIKAQLKPPDNATSQSLTKPLVNLFLGLGRFIPEVGPLFGLADLAFNFATSLTTDPQGNKKIDLTSTIGNLQAQAIDQFTDQAATTGTFFELISQDWGKLSALGTALSNQQDKTSPWNWSFTATGDILKAMTPGIRQAAYQNIMAAAYAIGSYYPDSTFANSNGWGWGRYPLSRQPMGYAVITNRNSPSVPLSYPFNVPAYIPYTYPNDPGNQWANDFRTSTLLSDNGWLGISALNTAVNGTTDDYQYSPPSEDIRNLLFKPVWQSGLGVYRPAFFRSWPFPRVQCTSSFGNRNGYSYSGGCFWGAAAPAPEQVTGPRPIIDVTMRALQTSWQQPRQPEVDVMLTIHNNGTTLAQSITIDSITLRTLNGVGEATVVGPALPIRVSNLKRGESTSIFLKLNVPTGVLRLSMTQQGTITSGNTRTPETFRFSEAQVLVPR